MFHHGFVSWCLRRTGDIVGVVVGDGSLDWQLGLRKRAVDLHQPYMDKGLVVNTGKAEFLLNPSEHSSIGFHEENIIYFDATDKDAVDAMREQLAVSVMDVNSDFRDYGIPGFGGATSIEWQGHLHKNGAPCTKTTMYG